VLKLDLGRVLNELETLVEAQLRKTLEPVQKAPAMSTAEEAEALALLKDPRLLDRILEDFTRCGVVGEETNKLVAYLASISAQAGGAAGGSDPELVGSGQELADGRGAAFRAGGGVLS
jgi:hypothetical protein